MILKDSRGWVKFSVGGRVITVAGEQIFPDDEPAYFIASLKSLRKWENGDAVLPEEIETIKRTLEEDFRAKGDNLKWG